MTSLTEPSSNRTLFLCRPEFAGALQNELGYRESSPLLFEAVAPGLLCVRHDAATILPPCIFERQRMVGPGLLPVGDLKPIPGERVSEVLGDIVTGNPLWTVHLVDPPMNEEDHSESGRKLEGVWNTLLRLGRKTAPDIEKRFRAPHRLKPGGIVLQLMLEKDGLWYARQCIEDMVNPRPGGITRKKRDSLAPSRSYLKVEEALDWIPDAPESGHRVIDLGAAPGGWTYAFVKRGCEVLSVDHGPMKLSEHRDGWGHMTHVRENGITFTPPKDWPRIDWLVADMLVAPGVTVGLLRRWLQSGQAERIICNIKLPQTDPFRALLPVLELMNTETEYEHTIRQLYHDRREVTVIAWKKG